MKTKMLAVVAYVALVMMLISTVFAQSAPPLPPGIDSLSGSSPAGHMHSMNAGGPTAPGDRDDNGGTPQGGTPTAQTLYNYQVVDLGYGKAFSINNNSEITGYTFPLSSASHYILFTYLNGRRQYFNYSPSFQIVGCAINDGGSICGQMDIYFISFFQEKFNFYQQPTNHQYNQSQVNMYGLGFGINNQDQIVGSGEISNNLLSSCLIDTDGKAYFLNDLITPNLGWNLTSAAAINDAEQIVGGGINPSGYATAFLYQNGSVQDIGNLGGTVTSSPIPFPNSYLGYYQSVISGMAINKYGEVAGTTPISNNANYHAFKYLNNLTTDIGTLGGNNSYAFGMNSYGTIVGDSETSTGASCFIYINGSMVDLQGLIIDSTGLTLKHVSAINDNQQIVGYAVDSAGYTHAILLNPVPPCQDLVITKFYQGDGGSAQVPLVFGEANSRLPGEPVNYFDSTGHAKTIDYGCTLCSSASMLSSIPGMETMTPVQLNADLLNAGANGYSGGDNMVVANLPNIYKNIHITGSTKGDGSDATSPAEIESFLEDHVCSGDRVILKLNTGDKNGHYVLVIGKNGSDWKIFDPGWKHSYVKTTGPTYTEDDSLLSSLQAHYNGFSSLSSGLNSTAKYVDWSFAPGYAIAFANGPSQTGDYSATVHSPVEILVTDPSGARVGYDPTTTNNVLEIPMSCYVKDCGLSDSDENGGSIGDTNGIKTFSIPSPLGGNHQIQLISTGSGSYTFDQTTSWVSGGSPITVTTNGTVSGSGTVITSQFFVKIPSEIVSSSLVSNSLQMTFTTQSNITYAVESQTPSVSTNWTTVQTLVATNGLTSVSQPATNSTTFFRVVAQ